MDNESAPTLTQPAASELVAACEAAWRSIQQRHPDLPDVVIVLGSGVERGRLVKLGHWWGGRWIADGELRGEVLLAGEALHLPADAVFEVLLHEAAHGLNAARQIRDCSRGGRYHNGRFKRTAIEVGLAVDAQPPYGWAHTTLPDTARNTYATDIDRLGDAMRIARRLGPAAALGGGAEAGGTSDSGTDVTTESKERGRTSTPAASCTCGRRLRMAPSVLAQGPVLCGLCGSEFQTGSAAAPTTARRVAAQASEREPNTGDDVDGLAALLHSTGGVALLCEVAAWREAQRHGELRVLSADSVDDVMQLNIAARLLLRAAGELTEPAITIAGNEYRTGELVVMGADAAGATDIEGNALPPADMLGTITSIDTTAQLVSVDFPIAGSHVLDADTAGAVLRYGYAEQRSWFGAPLIDLRTLPASDAFPPLADTVEASW